MEQLLAPRIKEEICHVGQFLKLLLSRTEAVPPTEQPAPHPQEERTGATYCTSVQYSALVLGSKKGRLQHHMFNMFALILTTFLTDNVLH